MNTPWWAAPEWANKRAMDFGKAGNEGPHRRVALTTEPHMVPQPNGQMRLVLKNGHPHRALRIYCGPRQAARC